MVDASDEDVLEDGRDDAATESDDAAASGERERPPAREEAAEVSTEQLRREVEEKYDFENFGPDQMAEMSADEWDAAFDPDTWITGNELLDRLEADLKRRVLDRDVFARIERIDGRVIAYSDEGYAAVEPDGSIEGHGTVLRDVKPSVALCSMDSYEAPDMPDGELLPEPQAVPEGSGELGNLMLQVVGGIQLLAGIGLVGAWILTDLNIVGLIGGLGFLTIGLILFTVVANARLSDRFRAEEYRNRLRAVGLEDGERPDFVPIEGGRYVGPDERTRQDGPAVESASTAAGDDEPTAAGESAAEDTGGDSTDDARRGPATMDEGEPEAASTSGADSDAEDA
jgi:hypothetical protein